MSAATDPEETRDRLDPDDAVGNILCDLLLDTGTTTSPIQRVLNAHGDWAEAMPSWQDYREALDASPRLVCRWPPADEHGETILVRATKAVGTYERVPVRGETTVAHAAEVSGGIIEVLTEMRGLPELVVLEDTYRHFVDGRPA